MKSKPVSQLDSVRYVNPDDLLLISRKTYSQEYGISYNINVKSFQDSILSDLSDEMSCGMTEICCQLSNISSDMSNISTYIEDNRNKITTNTNNISLLQDNFTKNVVKRQSNKGMGNSITPIYVDTYGMICAITSYGGNSCSSTYASCDQNGNIINTTYLNVNTGGTIYGDLSIKIDDEVKSLTTLLQEAGSVKKVNNQSPSNGNVTIYASHIKLCSDTNDNVYSELVSINDRLNFELQRLKDIV